MRIQTALCSFAALLALSVAGPSRASDAEDLMLAGRIAEALPVAQAEAEAAPGDMDAQEPTAPVLRPYPAHSRGTSSVASWSRPTKLSVPIESRCSPIPNMPAATWA
jgi:hypothetical protein